jgi:hypothetical protein
MSSKLKLPSNTEETLKKQKQKSDCPVENYRDGMQERWKLLELARKMSEAHLAGDHEEADRQTDEFDKAFEAYKKNKR